MPCENLDGWEWRERGREAQEGENICTHIADVLGGIAETNTALQSNYAALPKKEPSQKRKAYFPNNIIYNLVLR